MGDVTREDALAYVKYLEKNYSGSTRKNYFWCVVSMFSHQEGKLRRGKQCSESVL